MTLSFGKHVRHYAVLGATFFGCVASFAECSPKVIAIPFTGKHLVVSDQSLPQGNFVRFAYSLTPEDTLHVYSRKDNFPEPYSYHDRGIVLVHQGTEHLIPFSGLPAMHGQDPFFGALSLTRVCLAGTPIYYLAFGYHGDMISPDLFLAMIPTGDGYRLSAIPLVSGGILDVSRQDPLTVRTWDNLHEGGCNACETHYRVRVYGLDNGVVNKKRSFVPRRLYTSGDFDDRLRARLIP